MRQGEESRNLSSNQVQVLKQIEGMEQRQQASISQSSRSSPGPQLQEQKQKMLLLTFGPEDEREESLFEFQPLAREIIELIDKRLVVSGEATCASKMTSYVLRVEITGGLTDEGKRLLTEAISRKPPERNALIVAKERGVALLEIIRVLDATTDEENVGERVKQARLRRGAERAGPAGHLKLK